MQKSGIFISERMDYMEISKIIDGEKLSVRLSGRLDTTTAPQLEAELRRSVNGIKKLTLDFTEVEYISSAGLRVEGHEPPRRNEADRCQCGYHGNF